MRKYNIKNNIQIYQKKELLDRRENMLKEITKSDGYLPDSILHDDMDKGILDYVINNFIVISDGEKIPVLPKILTIQRWGEISSNWNFLDDDKKSSEETPQEKFISIFKQYITIQKKLLESAKKTYELLEILFDKINSKKEVKEKFTYPFLVYIVCYININIFIRTSYIFFYIYKFWYWSFIFFYFFYSST
jgi:hypothetical protein